MATLYFTFPDQETYEALLPLQVDAIDIIGTFAKYSGGNEYQVNIAHSGELPGTLVEYQIFPEHPKRVFC